MMASLIKLKTTVAQHYLIQIKMVYLISLILIVMVMVLPMWLKQMERMPTKMEEQMEKWMHWVFLHLQKVD
ncbi:MAG: hypothetical protein EBV77_12430 [Gemmatimonadaceae bacterium]|nr:hypothetical protein [Gemmatimonadaceae bacterium]